jgi:hypothetical protein
VLVQQSLQRLQALGLFGDHRLLDDAVQSRRVRLPTTD